MISCKLVSENLNTTGNLYAECFNYLRSLKGPVNTTEEALSKISSACITIIQKEGPGFIQKLNNLKNITEDYKIRTNLSTFGLVIAAIAAYYIYKKYQKP